MANEDLTFRLSLRDKAAFTRGMDDARQSIERTDRAADRAGRSFLTMGRLASGARTAIGGIASIARTAAAGIGILTGATTAAGVAMVRLGADAQETRGMFEVTFGAATEHAEAWVEDMHRQFGIATADLQELTAQFGIFGRTADLGGAQLVGFSTDMAQLALDISSKFNRSVEDAGAAIRSGLIGEAEPLRRFGIFLSQSMVEAQAAAMGFGDELTDSEALLVRHALILQEAEQHLGDLAATQRSASNQFRSFGGRVKELATDFGMALLPAVEELMPLLNDGLIAAAGWLDQRLPRITSVTREWASGVVTLARNVAGVARSLFTAGVESDEFARAVENAFGPRVAGIVDYLVDRYAQLRTNIADLGVRQGVVQTVEEMFGPRAASIVDSLTSSAQSLATIFTDALIPAFGEAYDRLGPLLGQVTESGLQLLAHVLGWAAENAERLETPIAILFGTWLTSRAVTTITRIAGAFRSLAGAMTLSSAAAGRGGLLGSLGSLMRFIAAHPILSAFVAAGGVATAWAWDRATELTPEQVAAATDRWEQQGGPTAWEQEQARHEVAGATGSTGNPAVDHILGHIRPSTGATAVQATPPQIPEGFGTRNVTVNAPITVQAWDGEDAVRALQNSRVGRHLADVVMRELEIMGARQ